jgi:hypothetical protein
MIKINNLRIEEIAKHYLVKIKELKFRDGKFDNIFSKNIEEIILSKPENFEQLVLKHQVSIQLKEDFKNYMIGQYNRIIYDNQIGYWLAKNLKVDVCPYCNINMTPTLNTEKFKTRPQLDHFKSKSSFPLLAISFYNLIPCCPVCNIIKLERNVNINPYSEDFSQNPFKIDQPLNAIFYGSKSEKSNWKIQFVNEADPYKSNIEVFGLEDRYNEVKDYAEEIVFKALTYNDGYYDSIKQTFDQMSLTKSEMDRIIFGNYVSPEDFHKRPLSKLTHDILEQFDVKF